MVTDAIADVPVDVNKTIASGYCNSTTQTIILQFFGDWKLQLSFGRNVTDEEYHMTYVSLSYSFEPGHPPFSDAAAYANESGLFHASSLQYNDTCKISVLEMLAVILLRLLLKIVA